ncbi:MAG: ribonuclease E/G [Maricaulis sp.]|uniref:Rne/Rng family ribonuclease n=1 Tax=Maricaulis sp. TaxID=1486257 RepID=UPI001B040C07|nr:ribonuclease E/G [Maricaulis sp.]MBO6729855.1 ribonuclease E/G [Maricaulis sp.]MBO6848505.1 ribonuclease E/G [Maricaulis sp.]MBO6878089.1 ribonuclease E/G [Maricaulis sp.]
MSKKMLIDAGHPEETRVVVVDGPKVEEFDFEAAAKRPIRGNIYLAKVTRVEPSLQAAFVEYGGNRHGFLAFNEIHPDYYQIPYEDRLALAEEEASAVADEDDDEDETAETPAAENVSDEDSVSADAGDDADDDGDDTSAETIETDSDDVEDDIDEQKAARMRRQLYRRYKIQEVIKRRQVLLVQVAKEERGNKGAALTTYLSLAGRYCVLMPNTPRGGGISRKISNAADRKRLKSVVSELELPKGVGLIIRTAGAKRTKVEIRRDADYLMRLWSNIREATLKAVAPSLIYEEGNLVKRAIRDLYDKEIDSVLVEGEAAYKEAKGFMRMLMPSHAKKVQHYKEPVPLFLRHQVENQLEAIYSPIAPLKSGGYLVINPTEALVSIDVNSGRATRERNIEATALKTNLEAATEAARQMRLRDLAGLIVIDFIDMDESKNNRAVEKRMKDVLKRDRARLQMGRISQFGLMEISRQRRRTSLIEGSTTECPHCAGTGLLRSAESSALVALRGLEQEGTRGRAKAIRITVPTAVALYLLNEKRDHVLSIEERFEMRIMVAANDQLTAPTFNIDLLDTREPGQELKIEMAPLSVESIDEIDVEEPEAEEEEEREGGGRRRRRRRRRRGGRSEEGSTSETSENASEDSAEENETDGEEDDKPKRRRRRGRRGGRGRRRGENANAETETETADTSENEEEAAVAETDTGADAAPVEAEAPADEDEKPKRKRRTRRKKSDDTAESDTVQADEAVAEAPAEAETEAEAETPKEDKPKRTRRPRRKKADADAEAASAAETADSPAEAEAKAEPAEDKPKPKRRTRRKKADVEAEAAAEASTEDKPAEETAEKAEAEPTEKPKRRRTRKKAADAPASEDAPKTEAAEPVAAEPAAEAESTDESKPKRKGWWNRTGLFGN